MPRKAQDVRCEQVRHQQDRSEARGNDHAYMIFLVKCDLGVKGALTIKMRPYPLISVRISSSTSTTPGMSPGGSGITENLLPWASQFL